MAAKTLSLLVFMILTVSGDPNCVWDVEGKTIDLSPLNNITLIFVNESKSWGHGDVQYTPCRNGLPMNDPTMACYGVPCQDYVANWNQSIAPIKIENGTYLWQYPGDGYSCGNGKTFTFATQYICDPNTKATAVYYYETIGNWPLCNGTAIIKSQYVC